jgi:hypothetical protein
MSVQGAKIEFTDDIFPVFGSNTCLNDYGIWTASNVGTTSANSAYQSFESSDTTYGALSSFSTAGNTTCESIIQLPDRASICPSSIKVCADGIRLIDFKGFNPNTQQWEVIKSIESAYKVNQIFEVTTTKYYTKFSILVYTAVNSSKIQSAIRNFDIHSGILQIQAKTN